MNSLDTNLLLYATNADCHEHSKANALVQKALANAHEWIVSDQVYFELYKLLRSPVVLENPLSANKAWKCIDFYRHQSGWMHCSYEASFMPQIADHLKNEEFPARRTFDVVLAATLKKHGVRTFYTRNTKDFNFFGWFKVVDPL